MPVAGSPSQGLCFDAGGVVREEFQCALQRVVVQRGQVGEQGRTDPAQGIRQGGGQQVEVLPEKGVPHGGPGGGGALAMAIALLGMNQCATVSMPGKMLSEDEILAQVKAGKKAYGFTDQHIEKVVPIILKGLGF